MVYGERIPVISFCGAFVLNICHKKRQTPAMSKSE